MRHLVIDNIEHLERKYRLSAHGGWMARLERIREAVATEIEQVDPDTADILRHRYTTSDLVRLFDKMVREDRRNLQ